MRTVKIYGASDDNFEIETDHREGEPDEIGCYNRPAAVKITANGEMGGGVDGLIVFGYQGIGPGWGIGIAPLDNPAYRGVGDVRDEGLPLPGWWIKSFTLAENTYSTMLTLEVPDDAKIEQILPFEGDRDD